MSNGDYSKLPVAAWEAEFRNDDAIKVAGIDADGILRGKLMQKKKFFSIMEEGFGFCR